MKLSARNQFAGKVKEINEGVVSSVVKVELVALDYGGRKLFVTYEDLMKFDNTEDFDKIILTTEY